jgi:anti-sigma regulatory factor (Ser/Thr protein kinase)
VVIPTVLARLRERAAQFGLFDDHTADRVALALTEALDNGIQHGNLELDSRLRQEDEATYDRIAEFRRRRSPYRDRRLYIRARLTRREAVYRIRDEGPGFDPARLPDPTDPAHLERPTGRGLLLIRAFMDEVAFNGAGNQITLLKRRTTTPPTPMTCNGLIVSPEGPSIEAGARDDDLMHSQVKCEGVAPGHHPECQRRTFPDERRASRGTGSTGCSSRPRGWPGWASL